jgi:hypothetical protein
MEGEGPDRCCRLSLPEGKFSRVGSLGVKNHPIDAAEEDHDLNNERPVRV